LFAKGNVRSLSAGRKQRHAVVGGSEQLAMRSRRKQMVWSTGSRQGEKATAMSNEDIAVCRRQLVAPAITTEMHLGDRID
jgi:hypothetical protein